MNNKNFPTPKEIEELRIKKRLPLVALEFLEEEEFKMLAALLMSGLYFY